MEIIHTELVKNGFKSKSENLKRDIYSRLYRLEKDGVLISKKEGGVKKYSLAKSEKEELRKKGLVFYQNKKTKWSFKGGEVMRRSFSPC